MRKRFLLVPVLAALPLLASGEIGLLIDKQEGKEQIVGAKKIDAITSPTGYGIRGGFDLVDWKIAALQLNATYHNKTTSDLISSGTKFGEMDNQYWAAGAMVNFKLLVNIGAGVEYRSENLTWRSANPSLGNGDTTYGRSWAKVNVGFSIPFPVVSPFFLVEVAAPLSKKDPSSNPKDIAESLAPQTQVAIYGGIRF